MDHSSDTDQEMRCRIGATIRAIRRRQQLTQKALGARIGLRPGPMNNIEQGRHVPSGRVLIRLADALQVSVDDLLGRTGGGVDSVRESPAPYLVAEPPAGPRPPPYAERIALADDPPPDNATLKRLDDMINAFLALEDICGAQKRAAIPLYVPLRLDSDGMEYLAQQVRLMLGVGHGVIFDYLELLENAGLRLLFVDLPSPLQSMAYYDAVNANAFIFVHSDMNAERQVFELIKRLGSIYFFTRRRMGSLPVVDGIATEETRAVRKFTAFFLMPENAVRTSVAQLGIKPSEWTYDLVLRLKHRYGVSAQSFVYRLRELGLITDELADAFRTRIQQHYDRTGYAEPDDTRRILSPNGRVGDLYAIACAKGAAGKDIAPIRRLFNSRQKKGGRA